MIRSEKRDGYTDYYFCCGSHCSVYNFFNKYQVIHASTKVSMIVCENIKNRHKKSPLLIEKIERTMRLIATIRSTVTVLLIFAYCLHQIKMNEVCKKNRAINELSLKWSTIGVICMADNITITPLLITGTFGEYRSCLLSWLGSEVYGAL